ncbi:MAG: universal stress protein [Thermosynechococcaceae cyanobacterium]
MVAQFDLKKGKDVPRPQYSLKIATHVSNLMDSLSRSTTLCYCRYRPRSRIVAGEARDMFNRILVALNSDEQSDYVIQCVLQFQLQPDTLVVLANVIELAESYLELPADLPSVDPQLGQFRHIEKELHRYQGELPCQTMIEIVNGDPPEEIVRLANIYQVDLIVLGSRGLTGVSRILQGSVSSQVVSDAPCTVMVVKGG